MYQSAENIPTTVHRVEEPEPTLAPMVSGAAVVTVSYKFGHRDRWATTKVITSNPNAPVARYDYPF